MVDYHCRPRRALWGKRAWHSPTCKSAKRPALRGPLGYLAGFGSSFRPAEAARAPGTERSNLAGLPNSRNARNPAHEPHSKGRRGADCRAITLNLTELPAERILCVGRIPRVERGSVCGQEPVRGEDTLLGDDTLRGKTPFVVAIDLHHTHARTHNPLPPLRPRRGLAPYGGGRVGWPPHLN